METPRRLLSEAEQMTVQSVPESPCHNLLLRSASASMHRTRLLECFRAVFPEHTDEKLLNASPDNLQEWDSTEHVILLNLIEQEFGVSILEGIGQELLSFTDFERYLEGQVVDS